MTDKYPQIKYYNATKQSWPGLIYCHICKDKFNRYEKIIVQEIRVSYMRGDDEVFAYCTKHDPRKEAD